MTSTYDKLTWIALALLSVPSILVVASWKSLPGDRMFGVKLALENSLLKVMSPSSDIAGRLQIKYTETRFAETKQLLADRRSSLGLPYLNNQVVSAKETIVHVPDRKKQIAFAREYVVTLRGVSNQLEEQKQTIITQTAASSIRTSRMQPVTTRVPTRRSSRSSSESAPTSGIQHTSSPAPTSAPFFPTESSEEVPTAIVTQPDLAAAITTSEEEPSATEIADEIDETQAAIDEAIKELEGYSNQSRSMQDNNDERDDQDKDKNKDKDQDKDKNKEQDNNNGNDKNDNNH